LTEERFRQDWVAFKADDQKRWTNYILTQDEQRSELSRNLEKINVQISQIEDELQELKEYYQQMMAETERRLQSLLSLAHDWVATFEHMEDRPR
jgi:phage shock protein A